MTSLNAQTHDLGEGLTTITFDEFTWDDGNGGYKMVSAANLVKLLGYSRAHYPGVTSLDEKPPYLVIWCEETAPPLGERPFLIGGLLALWLVEEDALPMDIWGGLLGNLSLLLEIRDEHARDIRPYHIPKTSTLRGLLKEAFPDALAVSFIGNEIFVELPELPRHEHAERLQWYPGCFAHDGPRLFYYNGIGLLRSGVGGWKGQSGGEAGGG